MAVIVAAESAATPRAPHDLDTQWGICEVKSKSLSSVNAGSYHYFAGRKRDRTSSLIQVTMSQLFRDSCLLLHAPFMPLSQLR